VATKEGSQNITYLKGKMEGFLLSSSKNIGRGGPSNYVQHLEKKINRRAEGAYQRGDTAGDLQ